MREAKEDQHSLDIGEADYSDEIPFWITLAIVVAVIWVAIHLIRIWIGR